MALHVAGDDGTGGSLAADVPRLEDAVRTVLEAEGVAAAEVSVTLLDDEAIGRLHRDYLGIQGPTDVLAFVLEGPGDALVGDIYIGHAQVLRQAADLGIPVHEELARLAIHGTLHLLGYEHSEDGGREESLMWRRQEEILRSFLSADGSTAGSANGDG